MATKLKIVFVGSPGVGNTTLLKRISGSYFGQGEYVPNVLDVFSKKIKSSKRGIDFWDSPGNPDYDRLRPLVYPATDVVVLTFSVENRAAFERIKTQWIAELQMHIPSLSLTIIIVANKCDLRESVKGCVTSQEALAMIETLSVKISGYCEVAALNFSGVDSLVARIIQVGLDPVGTRVSTSLGGKIKRLFSASSSNSRHSGVFTRLYDEIKADDQSYMNILPLALSHTDDSIGKSTSPIGRQSSRKSSIVSIASISSSSSESSISSTDDSKMSAPTSDVKDKT